MVIVIAPTLPLAISPEGQHFLQMCREIQRWMDGQKTCVLPIGMAAASWDVGTIVRE